jgi:hypothetical protein
MKLIKKIFNNSRNFKKEKSENIIILGKIGYGTNVAFMSIFDFLMKIIK